MTQYDIFMTGAPFHEIFRKEDGGTAKQVHTDELESRMGRYYSRCHKGMASRHDPVIFTLYTVIEPTRVMVALK
jgi:hypothetical protein